MEVTMPEHSGLLGSVPEQDRPQGEEVARFWQNVAHELTQMIRYAAKADKPELVLNEMRKAGSQYIWEFYVNDLASPKREEINWHGQNTSQWLYAGCILVSDGRVSAHH